MRKVRRFVAYLYFVGWDCVSLGGSACVSLPHVEIHLPFCFVRIGWVWDYVGVGVFVIGREEAEKRVFGYQQKIPWPLV